MQANIHDFWHPVHNVDKKKERHRGVQIVRHQFPILFEGFAHRTLKMQVRFPAAVNWESPL